MRLLLRSCALLCFVATATAQPASDFVRDVRSAAPDLQRAPSPPPGSEAGLLVEWSGDPQWLVGYDIEGEAFDGGLVRGRYLPFGSTVGPDGDLPVEIVFSSEEETVLQAFRAPSDANFPANGVGTFSGAVYDTSDPDNPRRLNVCLLEIGITAPPDLTWNPDDSPTGGGELLFIMASDYDGTGLTYADANLALPPTEDVLYVLWARVPPGRTLFEADPASLSIGFASINLAASLPNNGEVALTWTYDAAPEATGYRLYTGLGQADDLLAELPLSETSYTHFVEEEETRSYRLEAVDADGDVVDVSAVVEVQTVISQNATLVGIVDPRSDYGDVWGYVDPDTGKEYALLTARFNGLSVIDIDALAEVGFAPGLRNGSFVADAKDVKTYGSYAYVAHEFAPVQVIDLVDPTSPRAVGQIDVQPDVGDGGSHNILVEGDYLYVVGGRDPGGLRIYDLGADPIDPPLVSEINGENGTTYYHDLAVVGDIAYAAAIYDEGIDVIDLSDRANPEVIQTIIYPATYMGAHNVCATPDGQTIFVGDEIGSGAWTRVFDVSDLDDPELIAEIIVDPEAATHNCYVTDDNLLHIAHYTEGYQVFDVSDPAAPERVAFYDTYTEPGYGFVGAWTAYPYLPSGRTIVSTLDEGLFVVEVDGTTVASEPASTSADFALDAPFPNPSAERATIRFTLAAPADVRVTLYDVLGRSVAVLADGPHEAGSHTATAATERLANGAYVVRLEAAGQSATRVLTVQR